MQTDIMVLASRNEGVTLDELHALFGSVAFTHIDTLIEDCEVFLDDRTGIVYASGTNPSPILNEIIISYMEDNK